MNSLPTSLPHLHFSHVGTPYLTCLPINPFSFFPSPTLEYHHYGSLFVQFNDEKLPWVSHKMLGKTLDFSAYHPYVNLQRIPTSSQHHTTPALPTPSTLLDSLHLTTI